MDGSYAERMTGLDATAVGLRDNLRVPLAPHWPGFALDTLFYGTLVFLLWSAPGVVRRRVRKRRGRCPACGYDLRASSGGPCPECGRALFAAPHKGMT